MTVVLPRSPVHLSSGLNHQQPNTALNELIYAPTRKWFDDDYEI